MAHEITATDNVGLSTTGAWHGLGTVVPEDMPVQEAVDRFLNWQADDLPLFYKASDGSFYPVTDHKAMVRSDTKTVLGVVGDKYSPIQHSAMVEDIKALCGESGAKVHTIGSLMGGKRVWILLKANSQSKIGNDKIDQYIAVASSHDGSLAYTVAPTSVRIVCNNTLTCALAGVGGGRFGNGKTNRAASEGRAISIKHTKNAKDAIQQAREAIGNVATSFEQFAATANHFAGIKVSDRFSGFVFDKLFPGDTAQAKTAREALLAAYHHPRGGRTSAITETAFGTFNAVTEYVDYLARCRKTDGKSESEARAESSLVGANGRKRADALAIIAACVADKGFMETVESGALRGTDTPMLDMIMA